MILPSDPPFTSNELSLLSSLEMHDLICMLDNPSLNPSFKPRLYYKFPPPPPPPPSPLPSPATQFIIPSPYVLFYYIPEDTAVVSYPH